MISKDHNTNFVQIPPKTETRLAAECKNAVDWHTRSITTWLHLSLLADKRVEFSLCRFNFGPNPAKLKQPIQQLPKEVESRIIVTPMTSSRQKELRPCPTGERAATVEILKEATTVYGIIFGGSCCLNFQGTTTDGYLPRNALLRSPQSTKDSGSFTPPTSQWRANRYSVSLLVANKTQIGRAPKGQIAIIGTSRIHFSEIVYN